MTARRHSHGFTLVELLVVIAIIGILVSLLLPAVQAAREAARRTSCKNNLMQLGLALANYESSFTMFPPGTQDVAGPIVGLPTGRHMGWMTQILPFLEERTAFKRINFNQSVYDEANQPVRDYLPPNLQCPSSPMMGNFATSYAACHHDVEAPIDVDNHGVFFLNSHIKFSDIEDGSSHTIFVGERDSHGELGDLGWMSGTRWTLRNTGTPINGTKNVGTLVLVPDGQELKLNQTTATYVGGFGSDHPGGANFLLGDGSVQFLTSTTPAALLMSLGHRADGKLASEFD